MITLFKNFHQVIRQLSLQEVAEIIQSNRLQDPVITLRNALKQQHFNSADTLKKQLPAVTFSAQYNHGRKAEYMVQYNRLFVLDIDNIANPKGLKELLKQDPYVKLCFISPSGNGVKIIVETENKTEQHADTFQQLKNYFELCFPICIDPSGKDIGRLCFLSHDPEIYYNPDAKIFPNHSENSVMKYLMETLHGNLQQTQTYRPGNRNNFIFALAGKAHRHQVPIKEAQEYILTHFDLPKQEVLTTLRSAYKNHTLPIPTTRENFSAKKDKNVKTNNINSAKQWLNQNYLFIYNTLTSQTEYKIKNAPADSFQPVTEYRLNSLTVALNQQNINLSRDHMDMLLKSNFSPRYDPLKNYVEKAVEKYPTMKNAIEEFSATVKTKDPQRWEKDLKKFLVATVAAWVNEEVVNQFMLIFIGTKTAEGKTTWMNKLLPKEMEQYFFAGNQLGDERIVNEIITSNAYFFMDEMENMTPRQFRDLKNFISKGSGKGIKNLRRYARNFDQKPRTAGFIGCTNEKKFLSQMAGTRRFMIHEVETINYLHSMDMQAVYAEAYLLYKDGFRYWDCGEEHTQRILLNKNHTEINPIEELLTQVYEIPQNESETQYITSANAIAVLSNYFNHIKLDSTNNTLVGKWFRENGFTQKKRKGTRYWEVYQRSYDEVKKSMRSPDGKVEKELEDTAPQTLSRKKQ